MAIPDLDPFGTPDQAINPQGNDLLGEWQNFLDKGGRSALVQAGINMMQPMPILQSTGGHIASSIGSAGEALARREQMELAERAADTKDTLAEARIGTLAQQAQNAAQGAQNRIDAARRAEEYLDLRRRGQDLTEQERKSKRTDAGLRTKNAREAIDARAKDKEAEKQVEAITKELGEQWLKPKSEWNPRIQKYSRMDRTEIKAAIVNDPNWQANVGSIGRGVGRTEEAPEEEGVGGEAAPPAQGGVSQGPPGAVMAPPALQPQRGPQFDSMALKEAREAIGRKTLTRAEAIERLKRAGVDPRDL